MGQRSWIGDARSVEPGQLIGIRNPVIMDAAGTWTLTVCVDWYEASALDAA